MPELTIQHRKVADWTSPALPDGQVAGWWLGQAGFALRHGRLCFLIDPYLSDSLAGKYAGKEFGHVRMMPPPLDPRGVAGLRWVFCTHGHSDHMDGETLVPLARNNPACRFIVPQAVMDVATARGLSPETLIGMDDGQIVELGRGAAVQAVASAHEELQTDQMGRHRFLGYVIHLGDLCIYHSGDCVPYPGLEGRLADKGIDLAMLPVNGRDDYRRNRNVAGNFDFTEAVALCSRLSIPFMLAHHFGMFGFNTVDADRLRKEIERKAAAVRVVLPRIDEVFLLSP